jgi:hypothetical protein
MLARYFGDALYLCHRCIKRSGWCWPRWRKERREGDWAPSIGRPALRASLMAALSGLLAVVTANHSGARASSSSITTAWDLRLLSS